MDRLYLALDTGLLESMIMGLESSGQKITGDLVKTKIIQDVKISDFGGESSSALIARNLKKFGDCSSKRNRKERDKSESV
jgi:hypothetical protein